MRKMPQECVKFTKKNIFVGVGLQLKSCPAAAGIEDASTPINPFSLIFNKSQDWVHM